MATTTSSRLQGNLSEEMARDKKRQAFQRSAEKSFAEVARTGVVYGAEEVHREFLARVTGKRSGKPRPTKLKSLVRQTFD